MDAFRATIGVGLRLLVDSLLKIMVEVNLERQSVAWEFVKSLNFASYHQGLERHSTSNLRGLEASSLCQRFGV